MFLEEIKQNLHSCQTQDLTENKEWFINVKDFYQYMEQIRDCLADEEIKRSKVINDMGIRRLYFLRKGIVRIILSDLLKIDHKKIKYCYNEFGKPYIQNDGFKHFSFNISHSKEYLLIGVSENREIGVDVEKIKQKPHLLPESIFTANELEHYRKYSNSDQSRAFYKAWVQKEAICKALGVGITIEFGSISVNINPGIGFEEYFFSMFHSGQAFKISVNIREDYAKATALINNLSDF